MAIFASRQQTLAAIRQNRKINPQQLPYPLTQQLIPPFFPFAAEPKHHRSPFNRRETWPEERILFLLDVKKVSRRA